MLASMICSTADNDQSTATSKYKELNNGTCAICLARSGNWKVDGSSIPLGSAMVDRYYALAGSLARAETGTVVVLPVSHEALRTLNRVVEAGKACMKGLPAKTLICVLEVRQLCELDSE